MPNNPPSREEDRLRKPLIDCATALHNFICRLGLDESGKEKWISPPTHEEAQAAMSANNAALAALSTPTAGDTAPTNELCERLNDWATILEANNAKIVSMLATIETLQSERDALDWLGENENLELHHYSPIYCDDDDDLVEWRVTRVSGSINDREWTIIGCGPTPLTALQNARTALTQVEAKMGDFGVIGPATVACTGCGKRVRYTDWQCKCSDCWEVATPQGES